MTEEIVGTDLLVKLSLYFESYYFQDVLENFYIQHYSIFTDASESKNPEGNWF